MSIVLVIYMGTLILGGIQVENPFSYLLTLLADWFGNNYGLSIIVLTLIIRFLLLPLFRKQEKQQRTTQLKMKELSPKLAQLQKKMVKAKTPQEKMKLQQQGRALYKEHGINFASMGLLLAFVQMPILVVFYHAVAHTEVINGQAFLGMPLHQPNLWLALLLGACYFLQFHLARKTQITTTEQPSGFGFLLYVFPLLMFAVALKAPSAIGLYWLVGSLFMIVYKLIQWVHIKKQTEQETTVKTTNSKKTRK
ncbi:OxaA precursor [Priestia megaterium]|nr:OxaA precursor [Priestia megaterium]